MPTFIETAETLSNGTVPTSGNSGWDTVSVGTGSAIEASTASPIHGAVGYVFDFGVGGGATRLLKSFAESGRVVLSTYYRLDTVPAATEDVMGVRHGSGNMAILAIGSDGKLIMLDAAGAGISASRATAAIPVQVPLRIEMEVRKGTTTSDGLLGYRYFLGESSTPVFSWTSSAVNAGTADVAQVFIGRSTGRTEARFAQYDTIRAQSLATGWIDPYVPPNTAPTAAFGGNVTGVEPGATVTLNASASTDPDGGALTYTLTETTVGAPATLTGSGPTWTFKADTTVTGKTRTFTLTVTDSGGAVSNTAETSVDILPATEYTISGGVRYPIIWA